MDSGQGILPKESVQSCSDVSCATTNEIHT